MRTILGKLNNELLANLTSHAAPFCSAVDAAIAYATAPDHVLLRSCRDNSLRLTFYGLLDEGGAVSPGFLEELLAWGPSRADARLVKGNFHAKVIWWRGYGAYVGSANLTDKAWFNNVEAGIFLDEGELDSTGVGRELERLFEHLANVSVAATTEIVKKLRVLAEDRKELAEQQAVMRARFEQMFQNVPNNIALVVAPSKSHSENRAQARFSAEWTATLQLMRGLSQDFGKLGRRPRWVHPDAHPAIHFDQFLHAYYYDYVRGGEGIIDDEEELSSLDRVESNFVKHRADPASALKEAADWWASLATDPHGEASFIREIAPGMRGRFSAASIARMDSLAFREAMRNVNAFRMHARQVKNAEFHLPADHHESIDARLERLCDWLWEQRSPGGKTVRDVLEFVLWGTHPTDMEQRLWLGIWDDEYRLPHLGQSSLGEAVGWARPDQYPPRNNRTNKALRALGHPVKLFSLS